MSVGRSGEGRGTADELVLGAEETGVAGEPVKFPGVLLPLAIPVLVVGSEVVRGWGLTLVLLLSVEVVG